MADDIEAALRAAADEWERLRRAAAKGEWEATHHPDRHQQPEHWTVEAEVVKDRSGSVVDSLNRDHVIDPDEDRANVKFIEHAANADVAGLLRRAAGEIRSLAASLDVNMRLADSNAAELVRRAAELEAERDRLREEVARLRDALRGPHVPDESSEI